MHIRYRKLNYLIVVLGLAFIAAVSLIEFMQSTCAIEVEPNLRGSFGCLDFWLNRYQTLLTGFIALAGALLGGFYLNRQINQTDAHERLRVSRKKIAARTLLPLTLTQFSEYAQQCMSVCASLRKHDWQGRIEAPAEISFSCPEIPREALTSLTVNVEYSDNDVQDRLASLISFIQIQRSRLNGDCKRASANDFVATWSVDQRIAEAVVVFGACQSLFKYARRESELPDDIDIYSAAALNRFDLTDDTLHKYLISIKHLKT